MSSLARLRPTKVFVRASGREDDTKTKKDSTARNEIVEKRGKDVSHFYESVLSSSSERHGTKSKTKKSPQPTTAGTSKKPSKTSRTRSVANYTKKDLFLASEVGLADDVTRILDGGSVDVDAKDDYGWSALMVAACAGRTEVITVLLDRGADKDCKEGRGRTARQLADAKGHRQVVELLCDHESQGHRMESDSASETVTEGDERTEFFCEICRTTVRGRAARRHASSIVHQLSHSEKSGVPTLYGIPEANRGFQMMLRRGWDRERGLGPEGREGKKFPVRTTLKRDRLGVGASDAPRPRVTHFLPNDPASVERAKKPGQRIEKKATVDKRTRDKARLREGRKEVLLRQELCGL